MTWRFEIAKKKVWKGIHTELPVYAKINLVFTELEDAEDCVKYLQSNEPTAEYVVVVATA